MKVIVTGGAGFIASHIVDRLIAEGHRVAVIDNLITGNELNVNRDAVLYKVDIRDKEISEIFRREQPDAVIHHAAQSAVPISDRNPAYDLTVNVEGTVTLLQCCVDYNVKKIIFASSAAVYGDNLCLPIEEKRVLSPFSFYGLSKKCAEDYIALFSKKHNLNYTILRYGNVYGPRQTCNGEAGVIRIFIDCILKGRSLTVYGDGEQTRDFIFVGDIVEANIKALNYIQNGTFNIASGAKHSINNIIGILQERTGQHVQVQFEKERSGDIKHSVLNISEAKKSLHWLPNIDLKKGIEQTLQYFSHRNE